MKHLTEAQKKLLKMKSDKAEIEFAQVLQWVENEIVTFSEVSQGILSQPVREKKVNNRFQFN